MLRAHPNDFDWAIRTADWLACAGVFAWLALQAGALERAPTLAWVGLGLAGLLAWSAALRRTRVRGVPQFVTLGAGAAELAVSAGVVAVTLSGAVFLLSLPVTRSFPFLVAAGQLAAVGGIRLIAAGIARWLTRSGRESRHVLIVGSGPRAAYVRDVIEQNAAWGLSVVGFVDAHEPPGGPSVPQEQIHKLAEMQALLYEHVIDEVIIACPRSMLQELVGVVDVCAAAGVPLTMLSDLFGDYLPTPKVMRFGTLPALCFAPVHHNPFKLAVKRGIDILGSALGLVVVAPVLGMAALAIRFSSPGPALFRQVRCTLNGRPFSMVKLRTMYVDAEERRAELDALNEMDGPVFKLREDPRITPIGGILRRLSIDELPQLWNVLKGDMSLVGPRPPILGEVMNYRTFERRRLSMRPGLTCIWQVSGRNQVGFDDWVRMDLEYIDTWSLTSDVSILMRTLPAVLGGSGAS